MPHAQLHRLHRSHKPHLPNNDVPEPSEPGAPPVEPDEGPVPANIPPDPEHERTVDPGANRALPAEPTHRPTEVTACP